MNSDKSTPISIISDRIVAWQRRQSLATAIVISTVGLGALVILHVVTGFSPALRVLYILPVWLAVRLDGKRGGIAMVVIANAILLAIDLSRSKGTDIAGCFMDAAFRVISFGGIAWVIAGVEERLIRTQHLALRDPLTGLFNRRGLTEYWHSTVARAGDQIHSFVVVMIDCDGFKALNDRYGHDVGDQVLQILADVLQSETRSTDFVARVGGDEFVLVLDETATSDAKRVLHRIEHLFEAMVRGSGYECTISVGCVPVEEGDSTMEDLIHNADKAMYARKESKKVSAFLN